MKRMLGRLPIQVAVGRWSSCPATRSHSGDLLSIAVEAVDSPEKVFQGSDIVATCTDAAGALVKDAAWIENGMHLTNNVASEWSEKALARCDVKARLGFATLQAPERGTMRIGSEFVYAAGQPNELARLAKPKPEEPAGVGSWPLLADLLAGRASGRTSPEQVTFFDNHGSQGLQFAAVGGRVYQMAKAAGLGRNLPTEWFLQDIRD